MGQKHSRSDFEWSPHAEPHAERRKEILSKLCKLIYVLLIALHNMQCGHTSFQLKTNKSKFN